MSSPTLLPRPQISVEDDRTGMDPVVLRRAFTDHVQYSRSRDLDGATAFDRYMALALAVRDRLVAALVETQRTLLRGGRQARLLPLGRVPARPGPRRQPPGARHLRRLQAGPRRDGHRPRRRSSSASPTPASATAAWGASRPASSSRWPRWACPAPATASATSSASSSRSSATARRSSAPTSGCASATPGRSPARSTRCRCSSAGTPSSIARGRRLPGGVARRREGAGRPLRHAHRRLRPNTVNTLRLWAAARRRGVRLRPLQRRRLRARRAEQERHRDHLQGPLPQRQLRGRARAAAAAGVLLRRLLHPRHRPPLQEDAHRLRRTSPTRWPSSSTTPTRPSPSPS